MSSVAQMSRYHSALSATEDDEDGFVNICVKNFQELSKLPQVQEQMGRFKEDCIRYIVKISVEHAGSLFKKMTQKIIALFDSKWVKIGMLILLACLFLSILKELDIVNWQSILQCVTGYLKSLWGQTKLIWKKILEIAGNFLTANSQLVAIRA